MLVGRLLSYWEGNFSGAMLVSGKLRDMRYAIVQLKDSKMQRADWRYLWLHHRIFFCENSGNSCLNFQISLLYMNLFYKICSNKHRESCQLGQAFFSSSRFVSRKIASQKSEGRTHEEIFERILALLKEVPPGGDWRPLAATTRMTNYIGKGSPGSL